MQHSPCPRTLISTLPIRQVPVGKQLLVLDPAPKTTLNLRDRRQQEMGKLPRRRYHVFLAGGGS